MKALDKLKNLGLRVGISDLEHLAVLCPKVVQIVDEVAVGRRSQDMLLIMRVSDQIDNYNCALPTAKECAALEKNVNAMRRRQYTFISTIAVAVKNYVLEMGVEMFSLEDLLVFVRKSHDSGIGRDKRRARQSSSKSLGSHSFKGRCHDNHPLGPEAMVEHLKLGIGSQGQLVHVEQVSSRTAKYVDIPSEVSERTISALKCLGINRLYSHQAESIRASLAGKHVVIATMTSSGKSLCYNVPVLEVLSHNLEACALYLFPTKALAQDQLGKLLTMTKGLDDTLNIGIFDGDTSKDDRTWLRENARLLITNPDMLHVSIMPCHGQFRRILSNLRFIIVDEAHAYRGAFGCHTALILRRLRRICSHAYGSDPSFVFSTATSGNPREHAMELANLSDIELIQNDGSPSGPKLFLLWNPPLCLKTVPKGRERGNTSDTGNIIAVRSSPIMEVSYIFAEMVQHGLRCIAFCKSRKLCELVLCYTREILLEACPALADSVCSYRGGYIAEDRRKIEKDFFGGRICGIAATNALELGIDVGHIDATLHLGFPGTVASLWQQAGRSGRRENPSLAVYVAFDGPLDQYFMKFRDKLFRSPIECCHIDAKNKQVLEKHLACAALEYPLSVLHDRVYFGSGIEDAIITLKNKRLLSNDTSRDPSARIWSYVGQEMSPSQSVSIRGIETERYKVVDEEKNDILEEIEESKAFFQVYDGAVYMNQGKTYLVKALDLSAKIAWCKQAHLNYYTRTRDYTDVHVTGGRIAYPARINNITCQRTTSRVQACKVTTTWFGYYCIRKGSNEVLDAVELSLPDYSYDSWAVWVRVPQLIKANIEALNCSFRGGLHAVGHALVKVVPLYIRCNSSDIAAECVNPYDTRNALERILLYDPHPGGTGIAAQVQPRFTELLMTALDLLMSCQCKEDIGCPNCAQYHACREYNEVLHKDAAVMIIKGVLDAERSSDGEVPDTS